MKHLARKARWIFFFRSYFSVAFLSFFIFVFLVTPLTLSFVTENNVGQGLILILLFWLLLPAAIAWPWSRLMYKNYQYELTDKGLHTEYGVITKKYVIIPYDRIQNINIYRGIISRMLNLSDLHIFTAGSSGRAAAPEDRLPGLSVQDAKDIQEKLLDMAEKMRQHQGGL